MRGHGFIGIIIIIVGLSILFSFPFFNFLVAILIIWLGVRVFTGKRHDFNFHTGGEIKEDLFRRVLIFSAINTKLTSSNFEGGEIVTIFGGGEIDASNVKTKKTDIEIELVSIFGGIKLKVPKGWVVKSEGVGILGGFNNNTGSEKGPVMVHLSGVAIFGGVEVEN